ncbi:MAG: DUF2877 domain-containing protein [Anaerolineales bacterium]|nr:DUF2877 domain-containing protein [Anaerolineales bacterium]
MLSIFDQVCNLVNAKDEVLALANAEVGMGPFSLSVPRIAFPQHIDEAATVVAHLDGLQVGDLNFQTGDAVIWNPRPHWEILRDQVRKVRARIEVVQESLQLSAPEGSLAGLLEGFSYGSNHLSVAVEAAREPAMELVGGLRAGDLDLCLNGAKALAGLGGGLTPAGDDWIVGCLLALHTIKDDAQAKRWGSAIFDVAAVRTTTLSVALLRAAVGGACSERWHVLFGALLEGEDREIRQAVNDLAQLGHTSGADSLAGFVALISEG